MQQTLFVTKCQGAPKKTKTHQTRFNANILRKSLLNLFYFTNHGALPIIK
jgi:hypothetical protein